MEFADNKMTNSSLATLNVQFATQKLIDIDSKIDILNLQISYCIYLTKR